MQDNKFSSLEEAGDFLKKQLQEDLLEQIRVYGEAHFILPGGNSIKSFFPYLLSLNVPWNKVTLALSDERCVDPDHEMSNEKQLRTYFLNYISGYHYHPLNDEFLRKIQEVPPLSLLSMGEDGHLASLFPEEAPHWKGLGITLYKTKSKNPNRISLSEKALLLSSKIYILVVGNEKNESFLRFSDTAQPLSSIFKKSNTIRF